MEIENRPIQIKDVCLLLNVLYALPNHDTADMVKRERERERERRGLYLRLMKSLVADEECRLSAIIVAFHPCDRPIRSLQTPVANPCRRNGIAATSDFQ